MNVCVVRDSSLQYFIEHIKPSLKKVDLVLLSYKTIKKINYENEIAKQSSDIKTLLNLSKELNCIICIGSYFDLFEQKYTSILVCEKGKLLGIIDSVSSEKKARVKEVKMFITSLGSMGVIVNDDLLNENLRELMHKFEPRFIVNIADEINIKVWNQALQQQNKKYKDNLFSLTSTSLFYKEQDADEIKLNFCEYCVKEYKM